MTLALVSLLVAALLTAASAAWFALAAYLGTRVRIGPGTALLAAIGFGVSLSAVGVGFLAWPPAGLVPGALAAAILAVGMTAGLLRSGPRTALLVTLLHAIGVGASALVIVLFVVVLGVTLLGGA